MSKLGVRVPQTPSEPLKENLISIALIFLSRQRNGPFLKNIITVEEKQVFYGNVQRKNQWIDKDESPRPTPKAELYRRKLCCIYGGITMALFILSFQIVIRPYIQQAQRVHENLLRKRHALVNRRNVEYVMETNNKRVVTHRVDKNNGFITPQN